MIISVLNHKGGSGKTTIATAIAVAATKKDVDTILVDLDVDQMSAVKWVERRIQGSLKPSIKAKSYERARDAIYAAKKHDLVVIDGAPTATHATHTVAEVSNLIVIPTGLGIVDLEPSLDLADKLCSENIESDKIIFVVMKATDSTKEIISAKEVILARGYNVATGALRFKTGYSSAFDLGKAVTETSFYKLNIAAKEIVNSIENAL